jgi:hypothetical protein
VALLFLRGSLKGDGRPFLGDYEAGPGLIANGPGALELVQVIQYHECRLCSSTYRAMRSVGDLPPGC